MPAAILHSLAAAPLYGGQGTGLRLLELATSEAQRDGAQVLRLDCWTANVRLRQYYEEAGFTYLDDMDVGMYRVSRFEKSLSE